MTTYSVINDNHHSVLFFCCNICYGRHRSPNLCVARKEQRVGAGRGGFPDPGDPRGMRSRCLAPSARWSRRWPEASNRRPAAAACPREEVPDAISRNTAPGPRRPRRAPGTTGHDNLRKHMNLKIHQYCGFKTQTMNFRRGTGRGPCERRAADRGTSVAAPSSGGALRPARNRRIHSGRCPWRPRIPEAPPNEQ